MNFQRSQELPQEDRVDVQQEREIIAQNGEQTRKISCIVKVIIGYLYFTQGFLLSLPTIVPYIYPELPDYFTLSLFSFSLVPFSLKFISAPLLEKYSCLSYGKRKTWIMISQVMTGICISVLSLLTDQVHANTFAIIILIMMIGVSLQDISLDGLCLKQLSNPMEMSTIQASCQSSGSIIGGLSLMKLTSAEFANSIGLERPIMTLQFLLIALGIFLLVPSVSIHFFFRQTSIASDHREAEKPLLKVYSIYKYYFKCGYRYCYVLIFYLLFCQGFNFFNAGYSYELVNAGFSKNELNTITTVSNIICTILIFVVGNKAYLLGYKRTYLIETSLSWILNILLWIFFPKQVVVIYITSIITAILTQWEFLVGTALCANFPDQGASGMLYTMSASAGNFGMDLYIHTAILKLLPWRSVAFGGLILQLCLIVFFVPKMMNLIQTGETHIDLGSDQENNEIEDIQDKPSTQ